MVAVLINKKGKGEELKAPRHASAAANTWRLLVLLPTVIFYKVIYNY